MYHLVKVTIEKRKLTLPERVTIPSSCSQCPHVGWQEVTGTGETGFLEAVPRASKLFKPKVLISILA